MGALVSTYFDRCNAYSIVPHEMIEYTKAYGQQSRAVEGTETATSSAIYRNGKFYTDEDLLRWRSDFSNGDNMPQRLASMCRERADEQAFLYRPTLRVERELVPGMPKPMDITYVGERRWLTMGEVWEHIESFSRGLAELGLAERSNVSIYEETCWEWLVTIYGLWVRNLVASTVYANLGEEALFYALRETESKAIVCNGRSVGNLLRGVAAGSFPPCLIIYLGELPAGCAAPADVTLMRWSDVVELGRGAGKAHPVLVPTDNDQLALIMYTSGTTGEPKGVMHTHGSIVSGIRIMNHWLMSQYKFTFVPEDVYLSYLPLAHILEFAVVNIIIMNGARVGFGSPRTLTDTTARPHGDLMEYKPTCMIGVPRIFDTVRRGVESKLPPVGTLKRTIFDQAYESRRKALLQGMDTPFYNEKVFKAPRAALGGHMRIFLTGGGPMSEATQEFMNVVFALIVVGWGLTETVCIGSISLQGDVETGVAGQVLVGEELKLVDTEEYKHTDTPLPRGEICLRGPFLFKGYYKHPQLTKEAIDKDGWFHTGDVGTMDTLGRLRIIGRIKALAKNCLGEYISMEMLESIYNTHPLVLNNCACVLVDPDKNYICLLTISDAHKVEKFAQEHHITGAETAAEMVKLPAFRKAAGDAFSQLGRKSGLKPFECVRYVGVVLDDWTPENGLLTAAMKLKRSKVEKKYESLIKELFKD